MTKRLKIHEKANDVLTKIFEKTDGKPKMNRASTTASEPPSSPTTNDTKDD